VSTVALRMHSNPFVDETSILCTWNPDVKLTTGDEMRDRINRALDPRPSS
jgi:hypothetical protein